MRPSPRSHHVRRVGGALADEQPIEARHDACTRHDRAEDAALPLLGSRPMSSITPNDIKGVVEEMASKLAPDTLRTNLAVIRAVFNAAIEAEILARSPVRAIRTARPKSRDRPTLTMEQVLRLADVIGDRYRALVLVGAIFGSDGRRRSAFASAMWTSFDARSR